jgi:nucleoside-diphosphate-sugar epimerase
MNVFVAGGSGTIGKPLVRALLDAGHQVTALTRSPHQRSELLALGASVAVADALNRDALVEVVRSARPTHEIHQLTALPKGGPRRRRDLDATNMLRIEGTRHLLEASRRAGVRRFVLGSFALLSPRGPDRPPTDPAALAVASMEEQVQAATTRQEIDGVILRYGLFYGPGTPSTLSMLQMIRKRRFPIVRDDIGRLPLIHIDDAVSATVRAADRAAAGAVYDIVDDRPVSLAEVVVRLSVRAGAAPPFQVPAWVPRLVSPYMSRLMSMRMALSNDKAKLELGWCPAFPTLEDGLADMFQRVVG